MAKSVAIRTPIHQEAFALDPASQETLRLIDEVAWDFAIMFGRFGGKQVPLACDVDGHLQMDDASGALAELYGQLTGADTADSPLWDTNDSLAKLVLGVKNYTSSISSKLTSSTDEYSLADYFDSTAKYAPLYTVNDQYALAEYFDSTSVFAPLYDTSYGVAYWMKEIYDLLYSVVTGAGGTDQIRIDAVT